MSGKILIADDEVHLARILQFTLEKAGYDVVTAYDGREALDRASEDHPDLVILDLMLPGIDGYKVCNILKTNADFRGIPVIILSARDLEQEMLEEPLNADLFIEKPFNSIELIERISELLGTGSGKQS